MNPTNQRPILIATTESAPYAFEVVGLVSALGDILHGGFRVQTVLEKQTAQVSESLAKQARDMGADAVIGVRMAFTPHGALIVMGTAIRYRRQP